MGQFVTPRQPKLKLSAEIKAGSVVVPAGEYVIGAIKNGPKDWTMGLYPGTIARGASPEMDKVIKLESAFSSEGKADHLLIDITPGSGKFTVKPFLPSTSDRCFWRARFLDFAAPGRVIRAFWSARASCADGLSSPSAPRWHLFIIPIARRV